MAKADLERIREYHIPMNFIDESRVINGMFKTRNFVEGCILAALVGLPCWTGVHAPFEVKISLVVGLVLPFFLIGISGINGDPLSTFIKNAFSWSRTRGTMLYNYEARALAQAPIKAMMEEEGMNDKILDFVDSMKAKAAKKRRENPLVEGQDFVFAEDRSLSGNYLDEVEESEEKQEEPASSRRKSQETPVMTVDAEVLDVDVATVRLTSNMDEVQPDNFELFNASEAVHESPATPASAPVARTDTSLDKDPVKQGSKSCEQGSTQAETPAEPAEGFNYDDSEDGALF
jgi:hypothetical protein